MSVDFVSPILLLFEEEKLPFGMAESDHESVKWKRKRLLTERAALARAAKQAKSDNTSASGDGPGPARPLSAQQREAGETGEDHYESESENERTLSSDEGEELTDETAQAVFDDWMVCLPAIQRKTLAVLLMHSFKVRQNMNAKDAAREAGSIAGFNEKTVRQYRSDFYKNGGKFSETKQGKYKRHWLLNDENLRLEASMWVRENSYKKGEPNMTAQSFCQWVNDHLLPSQNLPPELPRSISLRTATRWLRRLGFRPQSHKKGAYVDGHERADVVASRGQYLKELSELQASHLPPPPCSDERAATPPPDAETRKTLVSIFHDESICNTNEGQTWMWAAEDQPIIQPKTKGSGIMVSDFIDEHSGYLRLSDEEHSLAKAGNPDFPKEARVLLEYGADREGYWNSDRFMANIENAAQIVEFKYPAHRYTIVWHFDQSSCHKAYAEDALNSQVMNVNPGGQQPVMRDTVWAGAVQKLVNEDGVPKGMKRVLQERGINTATMVADDMRTVLANHDDFRTEKTLV